MTQPNPQLSTSFSLDSTLFGALAVTSAGYMAGRQEMPRGISKSVCSLKVFWLQNNQGPQLVFPHYAFSSWYISCGFFMGDGLEHKETNPGSWASYFVIGWCKTSPQDYAERGGFQFCYFGALVESYVSFRERQVWQLLSILNPASGERDTKLNC